MNSFAKPDDLPSSPAVGVLPSPTAISPITSPPYWTQTHRRTVSNISIESATPVGGIRLLDNEDGRDNRKEFCWAKAVHIDDHVVVNGRTGIGAFVVWNVTVETLNVCVLSAWPDTG